MQQSALPPSRSRTSSVVPNLSKKSKTLMHNLSKRTKSHLQKLTLADLFDFASKPISLPQFTQLKEKSINRVSLQYNELKSDISKTMEAKSIQLSDYITEIKKKQLLLDMKNSKSRLVYTMIFYFIAGYINGVFVNLAENRIYQYQLHRGNVRPFPLLDFGFQMIPHVTIPHFPDYFLLPLMIFSFIFILSRPERLIILRRFFVCHGALMLMRSVTIVATNLPNPDQNTECGFRQPRAIFEPFNPMFETTCGDFVFSGHTTLITLLGMILHDYTPDRWYYKLSIWCYCIVAIGSLLAARYHYSIDILLALFLTIRFWRSYHWFVQNPKLLETDLVLYYLESGSQDDDDDDDDQLDTVSEGQGRSKTE